MKNPCEECLVKVTCYGTYCKTLQLFVDYLIRTKKLKINDSTIEWLENYEVRSRVLESSDLNKFFK